MIVDDDVETLDLLSRILQKQFEVHTIDHVDDFKEGLRQHKPDLIIIDHFIGCNTSKEIIDEFKNQELFKNVPVIIHSGHEQIEEIAAAANAAGYIRKPSGINEIRHYIEKQLGMYQ